ncbi:hypothetical protein IFR05_010255 [Cadophora sp. M221]|nr:hypothetical protein IFR05_010255 [Cadophora sp. M221]
MPTINLTTTPLSTRNLDSNDETRLIDCHQSEDRRIKSGDLFELTTDDPVARPLPSMAPLEMQWFLQRVMGMAGAADDLKDFEYHFSDNGEFYEDEGDISNLGLDEGRNKSFLSNVTNMSDPIVPDNNSVLPSIEAPKHYTEVMEEVEERFKDEAVM